MKLKKLILAVFTIGFVSGILWMYIVGKICGL